MHRIIGRIITAIFLTLVAGAVSAADLRLWTSNYASSSNCRKYAEATGPEAFDRSVTGFEWPMPKGSGAEFLDRTVRHQNAALSGRGNTKLLRERLLTAANNGAYTKLDFGNRGGSSPSFVTSVMVRNVAYAVSYLNGQSALSADDISKLDSWVNRLMRNMTQREGSPDHKASIHTARMAWGAAINDKALYDRGLNDLRRFIRSHGANPYFDRKVRTNNEVIPIVLMGAHIAYLNGIDIFAETFRKHTLHQMVEYHAAWVSSTGSAKVETLEVADSVARSILKADGWGTHQGWIPLYLAHFPSGDIASLVRKLSKEVKAAQNAAYYGRNMGVHSSCYFGH